MIRSLPHIAVLLLAACQTPSPTEPVASGAGEATFGWRNPADDIVIRGGQHADVGLAPVFPFGEPLQPTRDEILGARRRTPVTLTSFVLRKTELTNAERARLLAQPTPAEPSCAACPATQLSLLDALDLANRASRLDGLQEVYQRTDSGFTRDEHANGWRLPTLAEWHWAAVGDTDLVYAGSDDLFEVAWVDANTGPTPLGAHWPQGHEPKPVCTRRPNGLGLCDMTGNALEWVWGDDTLAPVEPPVRWPMVGCSAMSEAYECFVGFAFSAHTQHLRRADIGVRFARTLP